MKRLAMLVMLAACGGSTTVVEQQCGSIPAQDCGATMTVTMKYGYIANAAATGTVTPCSIAKQMTAEQYFWAVRTMYASAPNPLCRTVESDATATIDCSGRCTPTSGCPDLPGCSNTACAWQPPIR